MIVILVAVKQELRPILRRAKATHIVRQEHLDFYEGTLAGQPVALLALGVGKECARIAAEMTIKCYRPDLVISAGFGGGLQEQVRYGDIVIATEVLDLCVDDGKDAHWRSVRALTVHDELTNANGEFQVHRGRILTADEMILRAKHKKRLGKATGALTVDMETSAVAAVCATHGTDLIGIRCITDNDHESLPREFNDFFIVGQLQPSRILTACTRRPRLLADLARLGYRAKGAGKNLARFLELAVREAHLPTATARDLA
jgi:adenosylhomocysteine nucleosidase